MKQKMILSPVDGLRIKVLLGIPEKEPIGIVQILHGMCEHKERYQEFMEYLNNEGFITVIHDHRGHGESIRAEEDLGYMYGADASGLLQDARRVTKYVKQQFPNLPLILFGHSMGSLIASAYLKEADDEIDYLVLCGPPSNNSAVNGGIILANLIGKMKGKRHKSRVLESIVFGPYAAQYAKEKSRFAWICTRPEIVEEYDLSPLCGFTFTVDAYLALFHLLKNAYSEKGWKKSNISLPILFVGGEDDPCIGGFKHFQNSAAHLRKMGYCLVRGRLYEGMRHEILNEVNREKVFCDVSQRIKEELFKYEK